MITGAKMFIPSEPVSRFFAALVLLLFPATIVVVDDFPGIIYLLVVFWGVGVFIRKLMQRELSISRKEVFFFISVLLLFLAALITAWITGTSLDNADRFLLFFMCVPVYFSFQEGKFAPFWIWAGLALGAVVSMSVAFYQVFGSMSLPRARGVVHPIIFGDLALLMGMISPAFILMCRDNHMLVKVLSVMALLAGLTASALSKARGGWVSIPFVLLLYVWFFSQSFSIRKLLIGLTGLAIAAVIFYKIPSLGVEARIHETVSNVSRYFDSGDADDTARSTSIGLRFEMWKSAWSMFKEYPWIGGGWSEFRNYSSQLVSEGLLNPGIAKHAHPHNQYLSALAKGGVLSLLALIALYFGPAWLFWRSVTGIQGSLQQAAALSGLILVVSFMSFSLSEAILERSRPVLFFSFYLAVFMSQAIGHGRSGNHEQS